VRNQTRAARTGREVEAGGRFWREHGPAEHRAWVLWRDANSYHAVAGVVARVEKSGAVMLLSEPPPLAARLSLCLHGARSASEIARGVVTAVEPPGCSPVGPGGSVPVPPHTAWSVRLKFEGDGPPVGRR
jgi:hypothetical protein